MARLQQLVVDCRYPAGLARFWAAALDEFEIRDYDEAEVERLAALGFTPETDPTVILDGRALEICFQLSDAEPAGRRPIHLDVVSPDRSAEVRRLVELGASVREDFSRHTWMRDPEGNDFCVTDG